MKKILIATHNPGKQEEIKIFLKQLKLELITLADVGISKDIEETGQTFEENSLIKALYYTKKSNLPALADDGGMEIPALNNEPGVKSRRWIDGKTDSTDDELIGYTLGRMYGKKGKERKAYMRTVVTLALPNGKYWQKQGIVEGMIAEKPHGRKVKGYPYRSIFYLSEIKKYYQNELMTEKEKSRYNHRKKAIQKLKKIIKTFGFDGRLSRTPEYSPQ